MTPYNHRSTHYSNLGVVLMMRRNKCELLLLCYTFSRIFYNVTFVVISPKVTELNCESVDLCMGQKTEVEL